LIGKILSLDIIIVLLMKLFNLKFLEDCALTSAAAFLDLELFIFALDIIPSLTFFLSFKSLILSGLTVIGFSLESSVSVTPYSVGKLKARFWFDKRSY
jgi:hypothetical protein